MLPAVEASSAPAPSADALESRRGLFDRVADHALKWITAVCAFGSLALIGLIIYKVVDGATLAWDAFGISFIWNETWNAVTNQFGALDFILTTIYITSIAVLFAAPISIAIGLYLSELAPRGVRGVVGSLVEMLAAIPSVVLGLWGLLVLGPVVHESVRAVVERRLRLDALLRHPPDLGEHHVHGRPRADDHDRADQRLAHPRPLRPGPAGHQGGSARPRPHPLGDGQGRGDPLHPRRTGRGRPARGRARRRRGDRGNAGDRHDAAPHRRPVPDRRHAREPYRGSVPGGRVESSGLFSRSTSE